VNGQCTVLTLRTSMLDCIPSKYSGMIVKLIFFFQLSDGRSFQVKVRFDTEVGLVYFRHGGILNYSL
jgi:hypothetical protein